MRNPQRTNKNNKKQSIMKTVNHFTISRAQENRILRMQELKSMSNTLFNPANLKFKITSKRFKAVNGILAENAPLTKIENNCIWKLCHFIHTYKGRTTEKLEYLPMYNL